ncbi:MAG: aminotransferase class IV [Clostridia bacterium]|nr:aminotransferase class IV [Clostridia bacterium]
MRDLHHEGILYGYGLFETLKVTDSGVVNFHRHYKRLSESLAFLKMPAITEEDFLKVVSQENKGVVRVSFYKNKSEVLVESSWRENTYRAEHYEKGYEIGLSSIIRHSSNLLLQHKLTSHLNNYLEYLDKKVDDLIHLNESNHITEGIYTNIFFVKNGNLYTPHQSCGCLPGTQRAWVIEESKKLGIPVKIGYYSIRDVEEADEVFMTNAIMGIMPISKYEARCYDLKNNPITRKLMEALDDELL